MKNPMPLYDCTCMLDAYFLKNFIQRITCISVEIIKDENKMTLMVENVNYHKAKNILESQLDLLPSAVAKKSIVVKNDQVDEIELKSKEDVKEHHGIVFNIQMLLMNFSFSGAHRL